MRNPKVSVEKAQGKGLLCPCSRCPLADDLWYTHFPSACGCCHCANLQASAYYQQEHTLSPCPANEHNNNGHEKSKGCKVSSVSTLRLYVCLY